MPSNQVLLSVRLPLTDKREVLLAIETATAEHPIKIATVNPEMILLAQKNSLFKQALESMTLCTIDGSGVKMALAFFYGVHTELYHGASMVQDLFETYQHGEKTFYLLGDNPGVAIQAQKTLRHMFPKIAIVGAEDGGTFTAESVIPANDVVARIIETKPDILLVGFGAPKQELWIDHVKKLGVPVMIGVGGTFGFYAHKKRAPQIWQTLYLEWFYRSLTERGHAKRAFRASVIFPLTALVWRLRTPNENSS